MANWIKVFRLGHDMLIPTTVNDSKTVLFGLDTGAFSNLLSLSAGRQLGDVSADNRVHVHGLNGEVDKVYRTDKVSLRFRHFQQQNISVITIDLASASRRIGTEISGFLGFDLLQQLEVELDYRDGLVNFKYDAKRKHSLSK